MSNFSFLSKKCSGQTKPLTTILCFCKNTVFNFGWIRSLAEVLLDPQMVPKSPLTFPLNCKCKILEVRCLGPKNLAVGPHTDRYYAVMYILDPSDNLLSVYSPISRCQKSCFFIIVELGIHFINIGKPPNVNLKYTHVQA